ncbi:MAG TPA: hypothetical protein VFU89_01820, partial [Rhabdochlamydiaceae bacterium]|nr:hypothetical protein [Rhabdochlamydiaceae bacterium]
PAGAFTQVKMKKFTAPQYSCKTPIWVQIRAFRLGSDFAQIAYSHSSMSICAKSEPNRKSSDFDSKASFATTS